MRTRWIFTLVLTAAATLTASHFKVELLHQVQPAYDATLQSTYLLDVANIEFVVGEDGIPFQLRSDLPLPDNIVQALIRWRYRPGKAFALMLHVPVRRPLNTAVAAALRRPWTPLDNARIVDEEKTEQSLLPQSSGPGKGAILLGDLYALAALGVTGFDSQTGRPNAANEQAAQSAFGTKARAALRETENRRVLLSALATLTSGGRALAQANQLPPDFPTLCGGLLRRVQQFYPETFASCDISKDIPDLPIPPPPLYLAPTDHRLHARRMPHGGCSADLILRFGGAVKFESVLGRDGSVRELELTEGSLPLYTCTRQALLEIPFDPVVVNGETVEVTSSMAITYNSRILGQ